MVTTFQALRNFAARSYQAVKTVAATFVVGTSVAVFGALASSSSYAAAGNPAVSAATTAINGAQTSATSIITLGFAVAGAISALWVVIGIIKKVIYKAAS